jgi:hypothetical protein
MMEATETIQKASEKAEKKPKKYRAPWEKEGSYKYLLKTLRRIEDKVDALRITQRYITKGLDLGGYLIYDRPYLHEIVCTNEIDAMVLEDLYSAGEDGRLPKDIAAALNKHFHTRHYQPWHIRYILRRMNRKLELIGERIAEKRGMRWALTRFARKAWGLRKEELAAT